MNFRTWAFFSGITYYKTWEQRSYVSGVRYFIYLHFIISIPSLLDYESSLHNL